MRIERSRGLQCDQGPADVWDEARLRRHRLSAPEFIEDRDYLFVRFTRPVKTEGRPDDVELVLSMIRKDSGICQADIVVAIGMSLSKVKRIVADLRDSGRMTRVGSNRKGRWAVKD